MTQHHEAVDAHAMRTALVTVLVSWERAGCDCCSPSVLDDALDLLGYDVATWERIRHFAIELVQTAQNVIDAETTASPGKQHGDI